MPGLHTWAAGEEILSADLNDSFATKVANTGNETIAGIKTFSSIPVLPASNPTTDNQAVRKAYVDSYPYVFKGNSTTKDAADASGNQVIAHGLGRIPKLVKITVTLSQGNGTSNRTMISNGVYDGTTMAAIWSSIDDSGNAANGTSNSYICSIQVSATNYQRATITIDATNITLAWTKTGFPAGTAVILWEAY